MSDWNSNPFSDRDPWFTAWRGGARRRPKTEEDANSCDEEQEPEAQPGPLAADEEAEARPISIFKKAGWVEAETKFKTLATLFAEFQIHPALRDRPVEFQLLRRKDGAFVFDTSAQAKPDASGRATVSVAIHKEYSESDTFRVQARHGGMAWSHSKNTDREARETAEVVVEHKAVSGIHFPKNSSFIVPAYLKTFRELSKAFTDWRRTHPNARLIVFGHAERNEEDPRKLSERRAQIAFAFLTGDCSSWGRIAKEENWGIWEQQHMLQAMGFYEGKVDGIKGPKMKKDILDFLTWLNENECKGINPMLGFTEEYIRLELYRVYITDSKRAVSIPTGQIRTVSGYPYVGCAAFNRYKGGDDNHGENRRATFLMLEERASFPVPFPCRSTVGPCEAEAGKGGGAHQLSIDADCRSYKLESTADVEGKVFSELLRYDEGKYYRTIGKAKTCGNLLSADSRTPGKNKGAFVPVYGGKNVRGPEDLGAEISLSWTSDRLSVEIKVQDEAVKFGEGLAFDHIEWWFSKAGLTATDRKASPENTVQALIYCGKNGEVTSMYGFPERKGALSEITGECQTHPKGYIFRISIPGHLIARPRLVSTSAPQAALEEGDVFLMTFLVSDSDSGSKQESIIATSQLKWGVPSTFGRLVLVKEGKPPLVSQNLLLE